MLVFIETKKTEWVKKMDMKNLSQRNAHPYAQQTFRLKKDRYSEKFITGFEIPADETVDTILLDPNHSYYKIAKDRKFIESSLNVKLDGDKDNDFLLNYSICLTPVTNPNVADTGKVKLDLGRPVDLFAYRALVANGIVAPSKERLDDFDYLKTNFYFSDPIEAQSKRKEVAKIKNQIAARITKYENNPVWLFAVSDKLNLPASPGLTEDTLYSQLSDFKDNLKTSIDIEKAWDVFNTDPKDLVSDFVISAGIKYSVIKRDGEGNYVYDMITLGRDKNQTEKFLNLVSNNNLYFEIKEAIFAKFGLKLKDKKEA